MEKELKIAELASYWGVSVPTTWNRVRKEGLSTIKKIDENRKEVAYVIISENILNKYIITVNNNDNNGFYEDMLMDNNINNNVNNHVETNNNLISASELFDKLTTLNNEYNDRLERINNELINYKGRNLLLEDKAGREGMYLNEINTLKTDNKRLLKGLLTSIIIFIITFISLIAFVCYHMALNPTKPVVPEVENVQQEVLQPVKNPPKQTTYKRQK